MLGSEGRVWWLGRTRLDGPHSRPRPQPLFRVLCTKAWLTEDALLPLMEKVLAFTSQLEHVVPARAQVSGGERAPGGGMPRQAAEPDPTPAPPPTRRFCRRCIGTWSGSTWHRC